MTAQEMRTHAIDINSVLSSRAKHQETNETSIKVEDLKLFYGQKQALHGINMEMAKKKVTAYIG
ncbi:MAG: phosphate ABC transporter ATP-binding protein, partial [Methylovulum sp.]|nr:phosphate ABC transporter ATP-binding protein [Methylovulum sp.]